MPAPRVKVYGFLSLTKGQYILSLVLGLLLLVALLAFWFTKGVHYLTHPWAPYLPLVVMAAVAIEAIEVLIVLGKFRRLEAEQREKG